MRTPVGTAVAGAAASSAVPVGRPAAPLATAGGRALVAVGGGVEVVAAPPHLSHSSTVVLYVPGLSDKLVLRLAPLTTYAN